MMKLSDLTTYAREKYGIEEEYKWSDFPDFSVLANPDTGKWLALLMRQWDPDEGKVVERCDIKCGRDISHIHHATYKIPAFRMKGPAWIGVPITYDLAKETVFALFDKAMTLSQEDGSLIILANGIRDQNNGINPVTGGVGTIPGVFTATSLPRRPKNEHSDVKAKNATEKPASDSDTSQPAAPYGMLSGISADARHTPLSIIHMQDLYQASGLSFKSKCRNFYVQGKFMEDYEDDQPWDQKYKNYFTTYHDLTCSQLRGYFSWRTLVRKGEFRHIATSLAYMYVYELLCGIGASSPEDALHKMETFYHGYVESGIGNASMGDNLRKWMFEFSIINNLPEETAKKYADPAMLAADRAIEVLHDPDSFSDEDVLAAMTTIVPWSHAAQSPILTRTDVDGAHLFASLWRIALEGYQVEGRDLFAASFEQKRAYRFQPLSNAVYWSETPHPDSRYDLSPVRSYTCKNNVWKTLCYDPIHFHVYIIGDLLHEGDRAFRRQWKTGSYLRSRDAEAWAVPVAQSAIDEMEKTRIEASRPKIVIDLSHLDHIRQDAASTRDKLLTEEEKTETSNVTAPQSADKKEVPAPSRSQSDRMNPPAAAQKNSNAKPQVEAQNTDVNTTVLRMILSGESPDSYLKAHHLIPSIVVDDINEAFLDTIGDNVLDYDGRAISLVEDYRSDVEKQLNG